MKPKQRKCRECRKRTVVATIENYAYTESGLPNVTLVGVEVRRCSECGHQSVVIPNVEGLHHVIAMSLVRKQGRLDSDEIRFLRTSMGFSSVRFAETIGVDAATVSKWENGHQTMSVPTEHLLRLMTIRGERVATYIQEMNGILVSDGTFRVEVAFEDSWVPRVRCG